MPNNFFEAEVERRAAYMRLARERARTSSQIRVASVGGAHGVLYTSLRRGSIQTQDRLDEESLIPMLSASRNSIRGALKLLADEGLVTRVPRLGTKVVARPLDVPLEVGSGWGPKAADGEYAIDVTDERWVTATPVSQLYLRTSADCVHQTAVTNTFRGKPTMLYTRFTLADGSRRPLIAGPDNGEFGELFARTYGSPLGRVECWVEAKAASAHSAAQLQVQVGTPLIVRSRVLKDAEGVPREYSISHYLASRVNMSARAVAELTSTDQNIAIREPVIRAEARRLQPSASQDLRRSSAVDLHTELRAMIRQRLVQVGDQLDEEALALSFGTNRDTVREALSDLTRERILKRTRDGGAVVVNAISNFTLASGRPYDPAAQSDFQSEVVSSARIPVPPLLKGLLDTDWVYRDEHVIYRDGRPIMIFVRYSDGQLRAPRPLTSETGNADFASLFVKSYGLSPGAINSWVHAIRADEQIARRLGVVEGTVVLLLERLTHDSRGIVRELSHSYILASSVSLQIHHDVH